ncbi:MAG: TrkH family potassium uptake protein [Slackia piriformis]|uniref:TrkH family potassium uptake protein n=1 Tax=Slackia piriformis TaxID=626934 RepID=A0A943YXR0_9ACTN|nr:TrkH family potassium uptake protein [Slackia piriformis]
MWQKFSLYDFRVIAHYLGVLVLFLAVAQCVPLAVACLLGEWSAASRYLLGAGIALIAGSLLRMCLVSPGKLSPKQALAVTGFAWLVLALLGAVPMVLSGHFGSYLDAVFECMSSWTTTGASLAQDVDHMATSDNMWRFTMQCIGGQGVVVIALSLGLFGRAVDSSLYSSEGRSEHVIPNIMQTARFIVRFSTAFILIGTATLALLCLFLGMEPVRAFFNGLWLSVASFNTGGMTSMSTGMLYYHSGLVELVVMVLILLGSINFTLHSEVWKGRLDHFFKDIEIRTLAIWLSVVIAAFVAALCTSNLYDELPTLLRRGVFTVVSAFSSTGFQTISTNQMTTVISSGALLIIVFCMAIGGSAGSTSGGIKALRVGILAKELVAYIKDMLAPASARQMVSYYHVGRRPLNTDLVRANLAVFMLYGTLFLVTTIVTVAYGYDAAPSLFESVSMVSNIGMSSGIIQPGMPDILKILYIFDMWAGRLEVVTLIALAVSIVASFGPRRRLRCVR